MPMPTSQRYQALAALQDLLVQLFHSRPNEIRYLLRSMPGYEAASTDLPELTGLSRSQFMWTAVDWLESKHLIRSRLFDALIEDFQAREAEIRSVQRLLQRVVLFVTATPDDLEPLDVERDAEGATQVLQATFQDPGWAVIVRHRVGLDDLIPLLLRYRPDILHFSGHGTLWGRVLVEGESGAVPVPSAPLLRLIRSAMPPLQCVVWSACHSARLAKATVAAGLPFTIGMSERIGDETAIQVARGFYLGLGQGQSYREALETGKLQAGLHRVGDEEVPCSLGDLAARPRDLG